MAQRRIVFAIPGDLASLTGGYAYARHLLAGLPKLSLDVEHLELPGSYPMPSADDLEETLRLISATPDDCILMIDGLAYGAMPPDLVARFGRPIVALVHHPLGFENGLSPDAQARLIASEIAALKLAGHVIATSPTTARTLAADFGVPPDKITIAPPGVAKAARARGSAPGTPLQMLAVGSLVPRKGYDVLVAALAGLTHLDWRLSIAGAAHRAPETASALARQIADAGLADRIDMLGEIDAKTLDAAYSSADLFVMPSLYEGYGMVLTEALVRGLPVVATTGGAAAETVPDAAALKVPPGDAPALREALARAISDVALRGQLAQAAWASGANLPTWDATSSIVADALHEFATGDLG